MVFVLISRLNEMFNHFVESIKCCTRKQLHCSQHNFSKIKKKLAISKSYLFFFIFSEAESLEKEVGE